MTGKEIAEALKRYGATHTGYSYSRLMELWGVIIDEGFSQNTQDLMAQTGRIEGAIADACQGEGHVHEDEKGQIGCPLCGESKFNSPCPVCAGRGWIDIPENKWDCPLCPSCGGNGLRRDEKPQPQKL